MEQYNIYRIQEEFAHFFYLKSDVLYRFLRSYEKNEKEDQLQKQFHIMTMEISKNSILNYIKKQKSSFMKVRKIGDMIQLYNAKHLISLHIEEKRIQFWGDIIYGGEDLLFPVLRFLHPYFFVVGHHSYDYGWISPLSLRQHKDKPKQILYTQF